MSGSFNDIAAGNYTLTVTDENNCFITENISIGSSPSPKITVSSQTNIVCNGASTGAFTFSISSGTGAYETEVKDALNNIIPLIGSNPYTVSSLLEGIYSINVTDAASCSANETVTLTQPPPLSILVDSKQDKDCTHATGSVTLAVSGGAGALKVSLDGTNFQDALTFNNLMEGDYTATVKDANNCTKTIPFKIENKGTPPTKPDIIADKTTCNGEAVTLTPNASGITSFKFYNKNAISGDITLLSTGATFSFVLTKDSTIWVTSVIHCVNLPLF
jgi:hypothetical protein